MRQQISLQNICLYNLKVSFRHSEKLAVYIELIKSSKTYIMSSFENFITL